LSRHVPDEEETTMKLRVGLDEILPSKEAARALPHVIDRLERGDAEHFVITRRNKPRAVLVTIERYQQLLAEGALAA
jgi:prevent-host-death family protein